MGTLELEGTTKRIEAIVTDEPGLRATDLARRVGVHPSTADYHLHKLARHGRVIRERVGRQVRHYPQGTGWCPRSREIHASLTDTGRLALRVALEKGAVSRRALTGSGASRAAARWAIEVLERAQVLERVAWGVYVLVEEVVPCARAALEAVPCRGCNPGLG